MKLLSIKKFLTTYASLIFLVGIYIGIMVSMLSWGIPNEAHPFTYHMDEWHQLMAVRSLFSSGTSNVVGAANGPIFFFLLSGLFLGPFYVFKIIDPFVISSSVSQLLMQQRLFEVLRLTSILFGAGSIILVWEIAKQFLKIKPLIPALFFTMTPIFLMLSNFFKYDIALIFFITLSVYMLLWFSQNPTKKRFYLVAIPIGAALGVKISALPLLLGYFLAYILFTAAKKRSVATFFVGLGIIFATFFLIGIPDSVISWKAYYDFFYLNIIYGPTETANYILHMPVWLYLLSSVYPFTFGHGLYVLYLGGVFYICFNFFKKSYRKNHKKEMLIFFIMLFFIVSLASIKIQAIGNRALVLLPFMALIVGIFWQQMMQIKKGFLRKFWIFFFLIAFGIQIFEVYAWLQIKHGMNSRNEASIWMQQNLKKQTIGIENIPIYQGLPDVVLLEFYTLQENPQAYTQFSYMIIDAKTKELPETIIVTNTEFEKRMYKKSSKNDLLKRLEKDKYRVIQKFTPSWDLYQLYAPIDTAAYLGLTPLDTISVYQKK